MLRKGEVRVNSKRIQHTYRLQLGDRVRLPPVYTKKAAKKTPNEQQKRMLQDCILYEDSALYVLNKPAGLVVHSGSRQQCGIIEILRSMERYSQAVTLVHRLDKLTSGCLLLAKDTAALRFLHKEMKNGAIQKTYKALLSGRLKKTHYRIAAPLQRDRLRLGERAVEVSEIGKAALSYFKAQKYYPDATLVEVDLATGRTHQIRVHAQHIGHPVAGDHKYGDKRYNQQFRKTGLRRLFLHAAALSFRSPDKKNRLNIIAPLPKELTLFLQQLNSK